MKERGVKFHSRYGELRGAVVIKAEGMTLQHLEAKSLTLVTIYIHWHDRQGKLAGILHLEALSDGKKGLIAAQTCKRQK